MMNRKLICSNEVIDYVKKYSPIELKMFYNMLYCYKEQKLYKNKNIEDDEIVCIELYDLKNYLGYKHLATTDVKALIFNMPKSIYSKDGCTYISIFDFIQYDIYTNEIRYKICDSFKPYLNDVISDFTVLELGELASLRSKYSQRLFEFASKNKNLASYLMKIDEFKDYFQIPSTYAMGNIDQKILIPMVKDVNDNTSINIEISKMKNKNKITHILFKFKMKKTLDI